MTAFTVTKVESREATVKTVKPNGEVEYVHGDTFSEWIIKNAKGRAVAWCHSEEAADAVVGRWADKRRDG